MKSKKIWIFTFIILTFLSGCTAEYKGEEAKEPLGVFSRKESTKKEQKNEEMRAVWISCYELSMEAEKGGTAESFTGKIDEMFENVKKLGCNTVIVHVRPFSDAFYKSEIYPYSKYLTGTQGQTTDYDPLKIMSEKAREKGLYIHAWINPYRVSYSDDIEELSLENPARKWIEDSSPENDSWVLRSESGIYYNPTVPEVHRLIIDGVREILTYNIDAIHMDDYFYPTTDESIDRVQYEEYRLSGGSKDLGAWRRENVSSFVSSLYSIIKTNKPDVALGISPAGSIEKNLNELYADVEEWGKESGYADYLAPQIYYGFKHSKSPFEESCREWEKKVTNKNVALIVGLAFYKSGEEDKFAGDGLREWCDENDIISRQVKFIRGIKSCQGFALYSYSGIFQNKISENVKKELESLKNMI